jgi:hypothetical protein
VNLLLAGRFDEILCCCTGLRTKYWWFSFQNAEQREAGGQVVMGSSERTPLLKPEDSIVVQVKIFFLQLVVDSCMCCK